MKEGDAETQVGSTEEIEDDQVRDEEDVDALDEQRLAVMAKTRGRRRG